MPDNDEQVEVFYNSTCPVCRAGINDQRKTLDRAGVGENTTFVDMTQLPAALAEDGISLDQVRRHFYVRDTDGKLHRGADAAAILWRMTARRRWLGWLISTPVLRPVARVFYDWFADRLYNWNQRKGRW
jgi:predicted DCC family thiol-disulfide oxidoreductase YuxK